jgi:hypothetical protein
MHTTRTSVTRRLLLFSVLNLTVAIIFYLQKPAQSSLQLLNRDVHAQVGVDSSYFIEQAWQTARAGLPIYTTLVYQRHLKFQYPTSSILLGYVSSGLGTSMHTVVTWLVMVSWLLTLVLGGEIFLLVLPHSLKSPPERGYRWSVRVLLVSIGVLFYPLIVGVQIGQIQTLLTFLFVLAIYLWMQDRKLATGLCLAAICVFKPQMMVFLLWGLLRKQWRFVGIFAAAVIVMQGVAIACFGWHNELDYLGVLSFISRHGEVVGENQSVNGMLQRIVGIHNWLDAPRDYFSYPPYQPVVYFGTVISSAALYLFGLTIPMLKRWQSTTADFVLFGMIATIASPIAWTHHYGLFYGATAFYLATVLKQTGRIPWSFIVCFLLMANYIHILGKYYTLWWVNPFFNYVLYAGLGMVWLIAFGLRHASESQDAARSRTYTHS